MVASIFTSVLSADTGGIFQVIIGYGHTFFVPVLVLCLLIFVHELGHFLVAKKLGVGVEKFSLGFGPKIFGKKIGETEYLLSIVPLGGYVKLSGEDPSEECEDKEHSFTEASVWRRLAIVSAGPISNLLFAVFIFTLVYMIGVPSLSAEIGKVRVESPAMKAGLMVKDKIIAIDENKISLWEELRNIVHNSPNKKLVFKVERNTEELTIIITPESRESKNLFGEMVKIGLIGIEPTSNLITERYNPGTAAYKGFQKTWEITYLTVLSIKKLIQRVIPADNIGGPIFILKMAGDQARVGLLSLAFFIALLSINLGVLNLFPIPILDGGHILFFLIEAIIGKPIAEKKREVAQQVGIAMLVSLMVFAFYNDIMRYFFK